MEYYVPDNFYLKLYSKRGDRELLLDIGFIDLNNPNQRKEFEDYHKRYYDNGGMEYNFDLVIIPMCNEPIMRRIK
jgi:hypothetical protein